MEETAEEKGAHLGLIGCERMLIDILTMAIHAGWIPLIGLFKERCIALRINKV